MSLLGRKLSLRKFLRPGFILMIPVFFGCETAEDIGIEYELDSNASVRFVEFTLPTSNVYIDSLRTDGENRILAGIYNDEITGSNTAEGYFNFSYRTGPMPSDEEFIDSTGVYRVPDDTLQLDSMVLILDSETVLPLRGNVFQDLSLYELQDTLINSAFYLSTLKAPEGNLIGSFSRTINAATDTIFRFRLNDSFTLPFFEELRGIAKDSTRTVRGEAFQSLGVVPNNGSESISLFNLASDTSSMVVYTSPISSPSDTTYVTTFQLTGKNYSYVDRSSSTFNGLEDREQFELPSGETIVDPLYGISTTYSIAEVEEFVEENPNIIINNASFHFNFRNETLRDTLLNSFSFFFGENGHFGPGLQTNSFTSLIMNDGAYLTGRSSPAATILNEDRDELTLSATLFLQTLYTSSLEAGSLEFELFSFDPFPLNELVLISASNVSLQRAIFPEDGIKLRIYYTEIN